MKLSLSGKYKICNENVPGKSKRATDG